MAIYRGTRASEPIHAEDIEPDSIYAGAGNDHIYASPFEILVDGGSGNDTLDFSLYTDAAQRGVNARLFGGELGVWPETGNVYITGTIKFVENLVGSPYNDALQGNGQVNKIDGGAGNDWVMAYGSGDFLTGGPDADKFVLDDVAKKATITDFEVGVDKLFFTIAPEITWVFGTGFDAAKQPHDAWIGTYVDRHGYTDKVYLLDVPATLIPSSDWIMSLG